MTDPAIGMGEILGAGAFIVVVLRTIFDFLGPRLKAKNGNGTSGEKTPDYWLRSIEEIVEKVMDRRNDKLRVMMRDTVEEALRRKGL